ncbi:hypothetical protein BDAP_000408 [Binucleata daphniae]
MPNGMVCYVSNYYPGSKHDFSIFLNSLVMYKKLIRKKNDIRAYYHIMADKGYEEASHYLPSILPKKAETSHQKRQEKMSESVLTE